MGDEADVVVVAAAAAAAAAAVPILRFLTGGAFVPVEDADQERYAEIKKKKESYFIHVHVYSNYLSSCVVIYLKKNKKNKKNKKKLESNQESLVVNLPGVDGFRVGAAPGSPRRRETGATGVAWSTVTALAT